MEHAEALHSCASDIHCADSKPSTPLQALDKLGVSVDPTGDVVAFQAEPIAALLAIGLPGGPAQLPQEHHGALITDL